MSGTKVKLFLTINLLFNCKCLDVGSPVEISAFKMSAKGRGIRDPPRSRRNKYITHYMELSNRLYC